jgi:hypothetical protein
MSGLDEFLNEFEAVEFLLDNNECSKCKNSLFDCKCRIKSCPICDINCNTNGGQGEHILHYHNEYAQKYSRLTKETFK